jgi:hypothetical protein
MAFSPAVGMSFAIGGRSFHRSTGIDVYSFARSIFPQLWWTVQSARPSRTRFFQKSKAEPCLPVHSRTAGNQSQFLQLAACSLQQLTTDNEQRTPRSGTDISFFILDDDLYVD